jgi:hypothetical protein
VAASPTTGSVIQGNNASTLTTVTLLGGTTQQVDLSYTGCPTSATCTFTPEFGNPTYNSTFKVATTMSTPAATYAINITGSNGSFTRTTTYTLTVNAACTRVNPVVLIKPDLQSGSAGSTRTYTTNVTNTDSSGCGSSTFSMSKTIPSLWNASFSNGNLAIAPGNTASTSFSLTSNINATLGNYTFTNTATNLNASSFTGNDTAIFQII